MKIKTIVAVLAISLTIQVNAQWDTLSTGYNLKYEAIAFKDANNGVLVGNDLTLAGWGQILVTTDGGNSWGSPLAYQLERHDVDYTPMGSYWIVGDSGRVIFLGWPSSGFIFQGYISQSDLYCGFPVNDSAFFCAGENGVLYRTLNSGLVWDTLSSGTGENINDIYFTDAANGWLVADGGYVATTSDSGNTWTFVQQPLWGFYDYNSFSFQGTSGTNPYVVGETGKALSSLDGGNSWYSIATGTTNNLNCVRFGTNNAGLMCGDNGFIYRTDNAAWSWNADNSPSNADLFDIAFADDSTAFICGDSGVVLRSTINISTVEESSSSVITASAFPNPFNGTLFVDVELNNSSPVEIRINDITGKQIRVNTIANATAGHNRIEVSGTEELAAGMYFITITTSDAMITLPVVRQ